MANTCRRVLPVLLLCLLAMLVFGRESLGPDTRWPDESVHIMDGVLVHDWVKSWPSQMFSPMRFATLQYAHYPAMGFGVHYPPGFAVCESVVISLLGVSAAAGRITVLLFAAAAMLGLYRLLRRFLGDGCAFLGCLGLLAMPLCVTWSRQAMLEMPTLAVLVWSAVSFFWYLDRPSWRRLLLFCLVAVLPPFFKQTAIFLLPVLFVWALFQCRRGKLPLRHVLTAMAIIGVPLVAFLIVTLKAGGLGPQLITRGRGLAQWFGPESIGFVFGHLSAGAGWPIVLLAAGGFVAGIRQRSTLWIFSCAWFGAFVLTAVMIQHKEDRYLFWGLPPFAMLAAQLAHRLRGHLKMPLQWACLALLTIAASAYGYSLPVSPGREFVSAVQTYQDQMRHKIVLYVGQHEPDFILAARQVLGPNAAVILRSSKLFYSCASDPRFCYEEYVKTVQDVQAIVDYYQPVLVFMEAQNTLQIRPHELFGSFIAHSPDYRQVSSLNTAVRSSRQIGQVLVYARTAPTVEGRKRLRLPMPIAGRTTEIELSP